MARSAHERATARAGIAAKHHRGRVTPPPHHQEPWGHVLALRLHRSDARYVAGVLGGLLYSNRLAWPRIAQRIIDACHAAMEG